jgi:hypothetical protein
LLSKADTTGLPPRFREHHAKSLSVILTGHFYDVTIDAASVAANTSAEQTFTVNGLKTTDCVVVNKPSLDAGLAIGNCRVSAANTLAITYINTTAGAINPASEVYKVVAIRREKE